jgi:hypothetical protein
MKKTTTSFLLKGMLSLLLIGMVFTAAPLLTGCTKSSAEVVNTQSNELLVFAKIASSTSVELWTCKQDGTNQIKLNIPSTYVLFNAVPVSDGVSVIFTAQTGSVSVSNLYRYDISTGTITKLTTEITKNVRLCNW